MPPGLELIWNYGKNQLSSLADSELKEVMLDRSEEGVLHRSNSPFAGIIPERATSTDS